MLKIFFGIVIGAMLLATQTVNAQIVGEKAIGVTFSIGKGCKGLSYRHVFAHHGSFEVQAGFSRNLKTDKNSSDHGKGFFSVGSTVVGISYQPFIHAGDRKSGSAFYGNIGLRARIHHNRDAFKFVDAKNKTKLWITPDIYGGLGYLWEASDALEFFLESDIGYYNPENGATTGEGAAQVENFNFYTFYNDIIIGVRVRLN